MTAHTTSRTGRVCLSLILLMAISAVSSLSFAEGEADGGLAEDGPAVRRKLLYRSTRLEVAPLVGMTLADAYNRNVIVGANIGFHLTNELSISATAGYGLAQSSTSLRDNVEETLTREDPAGFRTLEYSYIKWVVGIEGAYVPLYGKFSLLNSMIVDYDMHLIGGVSFVGEGAINASSLQDVAGSSIAGNRVAPTIGIGARFYFGDMFAVTMDVRDYIFSRTLVRRTSSESELTNNLLASFGISFFLPGEVKVSR